MTMRFYSFVPSRDTLLCSYNHHCVQEKPYILSIYHYYTYRRHSGTPLARGVLYSLYSV